MIYNKLKLVNMNKIKKIKINTINKIKRETCVSPTTLFLK